MAEPKTPDPAQPTQLLERELLMRRASGDPELFRELLGLLRASCPEELARIRAAVTTADSAALERAAHSIKGVLQNFFRGKLPGLAYQLELMGREQRLEAAAQTLAALEQEYRVNEPRIEELERELAKL